MARFIRRFCGRDPTRVARTAIGVAACQQRNDLVPDQIVFDLRTPVVAGCSPPPRPLINCYSPDRGSSSRWMPTSSLSPLAPRSKPA